jgi:hypothetical protein
MPLQNAITRSIWGACTAMAEASAAAEAVVAAIVSVWSDHGDRASVDTAGPPPMLRQVSRYVFSVGEFQPRARMADPIHREFAAETLRSSEYDEVDWLADSRVLF